MEKFLYQNHPLLCNICGASCCGKIYFPTNLNLGIINEFEKKYIYSPRLHHGFYQKLIKCPSSYILIHIILNILNQEDICLVNDELVNKNE